jgi:hypothetical protein
VLKAPDVTVVGDPRPKGENWPQQSPQTLPHIDIPPIRGKLGDIVLVFSATEAKKLSGLGLTGESLRLTKHGIVLEGAVHFPGMPPQHLTDGVFLLGPRQEPGAGDTGWVLRLLPELLSPGQAEEWTKVWNRILPGERDARTIGLRARQSSPPPAFSWDVVYDQSKLKLSDDLEVPLIDARIMIFGNLVAGAPDGAAGLLAPLRFPSRIPRRKYSLNLPRCG